MTETALEWFFSRVDSDVFLEVMLELESF